MRRNNGLHEELRLKLESILSSTKRRARILSVIVHVKHYFAIVPISQRLSIKGRHVES